MRVIAGMAKGMTLAVPRGDGTRPTSDRVREAIFSSLGARVVEAEVLDLYAGTGALGLEAASRGARSVVFVEKARPALVALEKNLAAFARNRGVTCAFTVVRGDVARCLPEPRQFSLIFADPPYADDPVPLLCNIEQRGWLAAGGVFVLETAKRSEFALPSGWVREREATYGDTLVSYLGRLR